MTGVYPPSQYSMNSSSLSITPSQSSREVFPAHGTRDDRGWHSPPAPIRSMSLVTPEDLPPQYQARFFHQSPMAADREAATAALAAHPLYTPACEDAPSYGRHSITETNPLGPPGRSGVPGGFGLPQWGTYPQHSPQMAEPGGEGLSREWYAGSPNLPHVREENSSPHHYQLPSRPSQLRQNPG